MSELFYKNPRLAILTVFLIIASGIGALLTLGRQEDPTLSERFAIIITNYPGASAERVEALVSDPLESAIKELFEVNDTTSTSKNGVSIMSVELKEEYRGKAVEPVWTLVREKMNQATLLLPPEAGAPDLRRQRVGADTLILAFSMQQGFEDNIELIGRLARDLRLKFRNLPGTKEAAIFGAVEPEVRVDVDLDRLSALGLDPTALAGILQAADAKTPAGSIRTATSLLPLEVAGELTGIERIRDITIREHPNGTTTRLGDVALVSKTYRQPASSMAFRDGKRVILFAAYITPNQRVDLWNNNALAIVDEFRQTLPHSITLEPIFEQADYVSDRLVGLFRNLVFSAILVFVFSFIILGWRAAIIVGSALPLTIFMTVTLFKVMGQPLHQMSVTGIVIALGLLIDTAIVMVDEYGLMRRRGAGPVEAIQQTFRHLFAPLLASTLTTMLAFAPIALMSGGAGEFVGMMGVSVMFAVGSSFFLAFTLIPAFSAWFDKEPDPNKPYRFWSRGLRIDWLTAGYRRLLDGIIAHPWLGIGASMIVPVFGFYVATTLPMQFFPPVDRDMFQLQLTMSPDSSLENTRVRAEEIRQFVAAEDGVQNITWVMGSSAPKVFYNIFSSGAVTTNLANGFVKTRSADDTHRIVVKLQPLLRQKFPDARILALPFEQGPPANAPIELIIKGPDFAELDKLGQQMRAVLAATPGVTYTAAELQMGQVVASLEADETATHRAGLPLTTLAARMNTLFEGITAGSVQEGLERIPVRIQVKPEQRARLNNALSMPIISADGNSTPGSLGKMKLIPKIALISHKDGERYNGISAYLEPFTLPSTVMANFTKRLAETDFALPHGYSMTVGGEAENQGDAVGSLLSTALPLLILMIGAVVLAFNSFSYAGVVGASGVLSIGLALFSIWVFGESMGFMGIVGIMGLVGLSINGSIVVLTALKSNEEAKLGDPIATRESIIDATRHIIATTLTTIGGFIPLLLFGDSFWGPLAVAIAGGVTGSAVLALIFAPSAFVLLAQLRVIHKRRVAIKLEKAQRAISKAKAIFDRS
ncbi:AcrB/AcrD/AcrF family protein [hydrothermal vent metagenome]|uniref:AcrB/AcrD/AcrF family protein n=1 Tax=hydrothermal vent metagenome TaxID=652676 RepID=A0A3B0RIT2_9ZZZZ